MTDWYADKAKEMSIIGYNVSHEGLIPQLKKEYQCGNLSEAKIKEILLASRGAQSDFLPVEKHPGPKALSEEVQAKYQEAVSRAYNIALSDLLYLGSRLKSFGGYMYGGVVRDFFVRKSDAKDVDIWFTTKEAMQLFIDKQTFMTMEAHTFMPPDGPDYPFQRYQYAVKFKRSGHSYYLDFIISQEFPVNDFDVNNLILYGRAVRHVNSLKYKNPTREEKKALIKECSDLCNRIREKKMIMLDTYLPYLEKESAVYRVSKFIKVRGWTIVNLPSQFVPKVFHYDTTGEHLIKLFNTSSG